MDYLESFGVETGKSNYNEEAVYRMVILYNHIFADISGFLVAYQLTPAKLNALMILKHHGGADGMNQGTLSRRLMVTTSNMTRVLAKLKRDGLIAEGGLKDDRRVKLVRITPKASQLLDEVWPGYLERLKELTRPLSEDRQRELSGILAEWMAGLFEQ